MSGKIEWRESSGGSMGAHRMLMIDGDYVGHLYEDASEGVNVSRVLDDIESRYNVHDVLIEALEHARELLWNYGFRENDLQPVRQALDLAESLSRT